MRHYAAGNAMTLLWHCGGDALVRIDLPHCRDGSLSLATLISAGQR
jgi:hypothetical protein